MTSNIEAARNALAILADIVSSFDGEMLSMLKALEDGRSQEVSPYDVAGMVDMIDDAHSAASKALRFVMIEKENQTENW